MKITLAATLALIAASIAGWMLSASAVPMVLTMLLLPAAFATGAISRHLPPSMRTPARNLMPPILAGAALFLETWLFRNGLAASDWMDLPLFFHLAMGLLWWVSADLLIRANGDGGDGGQTRDLHSLVGIVGGLVLLAICAAMGPGEYGLWMILPVAAIPFALFSTQVFLPSTALWKTLTLAVVPSCFVAAALISASTTAADGMRHLLSREAPESSLPLPDQPESPGGSSGIMDGASRRLPREADVRFKQQVMVHLKAHTPELFRSWLKTPVYLRTSSLALFESDDVISPVRSGQWLYDADDGVEDNAISLVPSDRIAAPYTVYTTRASIGHLPLLSHSTTLFTDAIYEFADDWYQLAPPLEIMRVRYTAAAPPLPQAKATIPYRIDELRTQNAPEIYLELPPTPLAKRIADLTAGLDRGDPLREIKEFLAANTSYSLKFTTPEDSSPVEQFLFGSRRGHCEHYAAATVMMLRTLGVPARIAYGYAGGAADAGQKILVFRDSDFHAWAEVLIPDRTRWAIFDTTPEVPSAAPRSPVSIVLPTMDESVYHDFSNLDPVTISAFQGIEGGIVEVLSFLSENLLLATASAILVLAVLWWIFTGKRRKIGASWGPQSSVRLPQAPFTPDFLREFETAAAALGHRRRPGLTWREFYTRVAGTHATPGEIDAAIHYHYGVHYGGKNRSTALESEFLHAVRIWHRTLRPD